MPDPNFDTFTNLKKLAKMLDGNQLITTEELKSAITDVANILAQYRSATVAVNKETEKTLNDALLKMNAAYEKCMSEVKDNGNTLSSDIQKRVDAAIAVCNAKADEIMACKPENGLDADEEAIYQRLLESLPEEVEETPEELRDKLESLEGENRLDKSAISGLDEWLASIHEIVKKIPFKGGNTNGGGVQSVISSDGSVTITSSMAKGKGVIDLSVSVSGAVTILTKTGGTIDDSNMAFTFASKPTEIIVNGLSYIEGAGWSWTAGTLTATLTFPVGAGGGIYGRK